jgi:hypothetical protein
MATPQKERSGHGASNWNVQQGFRQLLPPEQGAPKVSGRLDMDSGGRQMTESDITGWIAAAATLLTFSMQAMVPLRLAAIFANMCFIAYGTIAGLIPIIVLHLVLLPCNLIRLMQALRTPDMRHHSDGPST